jgi:hypothetical protein
MVAQIKKPGSSDDPGFVEGGRKTPSIIFK